MGIGSQIMEPEKSHDLPSISQRTRKSGGIKQSKSEGLRIAGTAGISPTSRGPRTSSSNAQG